MRKITQHHSQLAALFPVFAICAALAGCATPAPALVDQAVLRPRQGLLVMQLKSNSYARLNYVDYKGEYSAMDKLKHNFVAAGGSVVADARLKKYVVMPMDAGDYAWLNFGVIDKRASMDPKNRFTIVANSINYIGQFDIVVADMRYSIHVADQADDMRRYLALSYPGYLNSMPMAVNLAKLH